jgi:pimeloyl-ACP methyl ester carboxylesterase
MDMWSSLLLEQLISSNYPVIVFDNRGTGNTTTGTKQFSINQFADDTAGLLDALKIAKADVLGWSMGSYISQELTLTNPDKVNNLILYASGLWRQR